MFLIFPYTWLLAVPAAQGRRERGLAAAGEVVLRPAE